MFFFWIRSAFASTIKLNEFSSASNPEWIELYNPETSNVNLNGWVILFDDSSTTTQKITLSTNDAIPGNGFKVIEHPFTSSGWLNNNGDTIILKDQNGSLVDSISYGTGLWVLSAEESGCRNTDGGAIWVICSNPTKGSANQVAASPTPPPTPTPVPTSTATSSPSQTTASSFTISNTPGQINSSDSFNVSVNLSLPENPNTNFYLKGAFKKPDSSNYFGLTKVLGSWIKNGSSSTQQFPITTNSSGNWTGILEIKTDIDDSGFSGAGNYIFKVAKYSISGNLDWSNETGVNIQSSPAQPSTTTSPASNPTPSSSPSPTRSSILKSSIYTTSSVKIASVAAATAEASYKTVMAKDQKQINKFFPPEMNPFPWMGLILIFAALASLGYIYWKKRCNNL